MIPDPWAAGAVAVGVLSVFGGLAGIIGTRAFVRRPRGLAHESLSVVWSLGILAVLPAWLVAFIYLIPSGHSAPAHSNDTVVWLCSLALGLAGVLMSEACLRHGRESAGVLSPHRAWSLGLWGMIPAWVAILLGLLVELVAA